MIKNDELEIIPFESSKAWALWLEANHGSARGVWIRFFKKGSGIKTVSYDEALDEALCYGWIDGQLKSYDNTSWLYKFTPRRPKSVWSKRNTVHVARLIKLGRMKPSGLREIEAAKKDGRWAKAYESPAAMSVPEDFLERIIKNKNAKAFYDTLSKANLYAIAWRLQTAKKPETREKRMMAIIEMLEKKEKFH